MAAFNDAVHDGQVQPGIGAIVQARNAAAAHSTSVPVINPHGPVHRALEVAGVLHVLSGEA